MKLISLFLLATTGFAQTYLVEWTSTEKCYECAERLAVICWDKDPACGTPDKEVWHYDEFATIKAAMAFINGGLFRVSEEHDILAWRRSLTPPAPPVGAQRRFRKLLEIGREIPVHAETTTTEEPQPPKKTEHTVYDVNGETGIEPPVALVGTSDNLVGSGTVTLTAPTISTGTTYEWLNGKSGTLTCIGPDKKGIIRALPCEQPKKKK